MDNRNHGNADAKCRWCRSFATCTSGKNGRTDVLVDIRAFGGFEIVNM